MSELICHAYDCSIRKYMDAAFLNRGHVLIISGTPSDAEIEEAIQQIEDEFSESMTDKIEFINEYFLQIQVFRDEQRIAMFDMAMSLQKTSLEITGEPFEDGFAFLNRYSVSNKLNWTGDIDAFDSQLTTIENRFRVQRLYFLDNQNKLKKQQEARKSTTQIQLTPHQRMTSFVRLLNNMKTHGFTFDKQNDMLIEMAIAVQTIMERNKDKKE